MELIKIDLGLFVWTVVVFLIFFWIMKKYAWGPIVSGLREREDDISNSLLEAKKAREEMANLHAENEALLKEARKERDQMMREANTMRDQIVSEAKTKAQAAAGKEIDKAKVQIESEKMAALVEIKNASGKLAVEIAEKLLRREFENQNAQEALAQQLIKDLNNN